VFSFITKLRKKDLKDCAPSASGVDLDTSWQITVTVTHVDTAASRVTNRLKRAYDARLNLETSIRLGG
jgi:hypothetical protein